MFQEIRSIGPTAGDGPYRPLGRSHCIGCGCHDFAACCDEESGEVCYWLVVDRLAGRSVCSACHEHLACWSRGNREPAVPI